MSAVFRSLTIRNYRYWFGGALVSNVGTWMQRTAQDWIVLTQLTDHDASAVGIITALQLGPQLVLTPITGAISDRFPRRQVLLVTQTLMGLLSFVLGIWLILGVPSLALVYLIGLVSGVVGAFDTPARQVFVSDLVPRDAVGNAVALNSTSFNLSRLAGPAVAGLLIMVVGSGWVFIANGFTFMAAIAAILLIRPGDFYSLPRPAVARDRRGGGGLLDGFRYIRTRSDLMLVMIMIFLIGTFGLNFPVVLSAMITVTFNEDAQAYGVISSVMGVGSVAGALFTASRDRPRLRSIVAGVTGFGLTATGAALAPDLLTFGAALVALGLCSQLVLSGANAYVQVTSAGSVRGRVMAVYMAVLMGGTPIGAPLVGWVANVAGPRWAMGIAGFSGFAAAVVALWWLLLTKHGRVHRNHGGGLRHAFTIDYAEPAAVEVPTITTEIAVIPGRRRPAAAAHPPRTLDRCANITDPSSSARESSTDFPGHPTPRSRTESHTRPPARS